MPGCDRVSPILHRAQGSIGCTLSSEIDRFCCRGSKNWTLKDGGRAMCPVRTPRTGRHRFSRDLQYVDNLLIILKRG